MALDVDEKVGTTRVKFTPRFYKRAYKQYKRGYYSLLIEMMNQTETDSHVFGCLNARRSGVQREFKIIPYENDESGAEWMEDILKELNMRSLFKAIQEAILKKFVVIDFEWDVIDGNQVPIRYKKYEHKYFKYDDNDKLKIINGAELEDIPDDTLVAETDEVPVLLPVLRDFILKTFGVESWASFLEVFGEGIIIGKYPSGAGKEKKDELKKAVRAIAQSSRGTAPKDTEFEIKEAQRNTGDHADFVHVADNGMSVAILGHENAVKNTDGMQVGENQSSYFAKKDIVINDLYFIDEIMQGVVNNIWQRNRGNSNYPRIETVKPKTIDVQQRLDVLDLYLRNGGRADPEDFRKLGVTVPEDQEYIQKDTLGL